MLVVVRIRYVAEGFCVSGGSYVWHRVMGLAVMVFEFGAVRFRSVEREDLKLLHVWENDFWVIMYSRGRPLNFVNVPQLERMYEEWVKDEKHLHFIVELVESGESVGTARLHLHDWGRVRSCDIGAYVGKKELWGKGLGKQVYLGLLEMAFRQLNVDRCEASSVEYNGRSHKALEAVGFKKIGAFRQCVFVNGRKWDDYAFDLLREEYVEQRDALLKRILGDRAEEYVKKHCTIEGY
jgi:RimJ/RimL family protein N-acetyltransferase